MFFLNLFRLIIVLALFYLTQLSAVTASELSQLNIADDSLLTCIKQQGKKQQWSLISDINNLKCHGMNIRSLKGLESLVNLKSISLFNNKLTHVDLHHLSQLEYINIANNKLKRINIKGLSNLKTLFLFKNSLATIDFTGLTQLKKVRITNNQLSSLDISPLISLEKAYFFDNKLKDLVIRGLPKLKFIELKQNPMPDEVYDRYDEIEGITIIHDGNADDWK